MSFLTCSWSRVFNLRLTCPPPGLLFLRRLFRSGAGQPRLRLQGRRGWQGQRSDFVPGQPRCGPAAGVGAAVPALPEPGLVGMLHHPPGKTILQRVLVTFGKRLPSGVPELLHVLGTDFLGHHGSSCFSCLDQETKCDEIMKQKQDEPFKGDVDRHTLNQLTVTPYQIILNTGLNQMKSFVGFRC